MLVFDSENPFPLISEGDASDAEIQVHSQAVDQWLGLGIDAIENDLVARDVGRGSDRELWVGLALRALQTPYTELRHILSLLSPSSGDTIIDLGAGYGRLGFITGRHYPGVRFHGYEFVAERVCEGQRALEAFNEGDSTLEQADLAHLGFQPLAAKFYFLYDYGTRLNVEKTLNDLRVISQDRGIVVVGRGRRSRDLIERGQPWLAQVWAPEHYKNFSIYRSRPN